MVKKYNFDIEVKGQGHKEVMNVYMTHRPLVIHSRVIYMYGMNTSKDKRVVVRTQRHVKNLMHLTLKSQINVSD